MTDSVKSVADLIITKTDSVMDDGQSGIDCNISHVDGRYITGFKLVMKSEYADFTDAKALTVAWLSLGLMTPLGDRTENLVDHGLSRAGFMVSEDGIEVARAYQALTGKDITEAI